MLDRGRPSCRVTALRQRNGRHVGMTTRQHLLAEHVEPDPGPAGLTILLMLVRAAAGELS